MGHSGGDRYFVGIVHSRWNEVAYQPHVVAGNSRRMVASPAVTGKSGQSLLRVCRPSFYMCNGWGFDQQRNSDEV